METWLLIILSLCLSALLKSFISLFSNSKKLPPGPLTIPVIGNFIWLRKSFFELEPILHNLFLKYGPIVTLKIGSQPAIFITNHSSAHRALVQSGSIFADRPQELPTGRVIFSSQHNISSASYGPNWRLFRRNIAETLHPARLRTYSSGRKWVLGILVQKLLSESVSEEAPIKVVDHFQYAMFCLLVLMCFGEKLDDSTTREIEKVQTNLLMSVYGFNVLNFWPKVGKIVLRKKWKKLIQIRKDQDNVLIPIIKARLKKVKEQEQEEEDKDSVVAYVDSLPNLNLPEEGNRKLSDKEMVCLCGEFLNGGTDTTSTSLQWIMANLVKYPLIQLKLYNEIVRVVGVAEKIPSLENVVKEEELQQIPYLKAIILESFRLHPPGHFVLAHSVTEETELDGYIIPKNAMVNFMVAEMGKDPNVWNDPLEFRPERFIQDDGFDITGSREIKMMPFGAGRRICPGYTVALLQYLEYFVANLVWNFEWKTADDATEVDMSEKQDFTVGMKNPLLVNIFPRLKSEGY